MSEFKPTASQTAAINARGSSVLVSAGAGSGKTRVLTERLMGYITDPENPVDLDRFLIITFTKAAAGELRSRIMDELSAAQAADPSNRRLRRQSALCRRAQIGTIHSFCGAILRQNSHLLGLSPDFIIADEDRAQAMKAAALERTLEAGYARPEKHPGFLLLADTVGVGRDDRRLAELVLELHGKMQSHARSENWAREQAELLHTPAADALDTPWGKVILDRAKEIAEYWSDELDRLLKAMAEEQKIANAYMPSVSETAAGIRELRRCMDLGWDRAADCLPVPFPRLGGLRNSPDPALSEHVKARRTACKDAMESLDKMLCGTSEKLLRDVQSTAPAMEALLNLTLDFDREYSAAKRRAGLVDYADLEHMAARLLTEEDGSPTELAGQISLRYTEIMVDEYQDVSQVQDTIFQAVSREGKNLFMVGDVKQSIYRFRLADPTIFTEKYLNYADEALPGQPRRIMLRENFRSRREILEGANSVFSLCMSRRFGDIDYDEAARLLCGAAFEGEVSKPELLLMSIPKTGEGEERPDKTGLEAALVAIKIKELVDSGTMVEDRNGKRPMEYSDVAILLRSANAVGGVYRRELVKVGVPVASGQSGGFFASLEVSTMLSMLAVIDNPHQDIPLIAVLRSPAFGFDANELSAVRACQPQGDFYSALQLRAEADEKCRAFLASLNALRATAPDISAAELVWSILERFDMLAVCAAMEDGERRKARLLALAELAGQFETTGYRGLHRFVLWLRQLDGKDRAPALGMESAPGVQILSVHKSKGLEFPVVFLCDTARRFNTADSKAKVLVHPQLGLGPKVTDLKRRQEYPSLARNAIKLQLEREMLSEELRLLYVALTRPKERLYVTAALKDPEQTIEKARASVTVPMAPEMLARAAAPVNWLIYAALADGGENLRMSLVQPRQEAEAAEAAPPIQEADESLLEELKRALRFAYPYSEAQELPSKITATELKGHETPDEEAQSLRPEVKRPFRMPDFAKKDKPLTGAERGIATHLVLQYMDFGKTGSPQQIQEEIERLRVLRFLSDREATAVNVNAIYKLFQSSLGKRILGAEKLKREFKFSLLCDAKEVFQKAEGDKLLMQGVVDCFFEEDGELVIVDYKTDALSSSAQVEERAKFYAGQLRSYSQALRRILSKPVKECVLYFLSVGKAVSLPTEE